MSVTVTHEMLEAGYAEIYRMANERGYGWELGMVAKSQVLPAIGAVYRAMAAHAPAPPVPAVDPMPSGNPGVVPPFAGGSNPNPASKA